MGLLAAFTQALKITRLKTGVLRNSGQHLRTYLLTIMESEDEVGISITSKGPMGS